MQTKASVYTSKINNPNKHLNVLTVPTHEAYQTSMGGIDGITFWMIQKPGVTKPWNHWSRPVPKNHVLLDGSADQVPRNIVFDVVFSQNKFGSFQLLKPIADAWNIPFVNIEHTLPVPTWKDDQREACKKMRGDINVFISNYSINQWRFSEDDPTVRVVEHGIDSDVFKPGNTEKNGKIGSCVNDWINRSWCCGFDIWQRVTKDLPVEPIGDTRGLSKPAKDVEELVAFYQRQSVFVNTSTISPVPTALLEAMSCGLPCVSTATCMIPEIIEDGVNGFVSNDEEYLRDRLIWCLNNPSEAEKLGQAARETIKKKFSLGRFCSDWKKIFIEASNIIHIS